MIRISEVDEVEVFKVCLEYWNSLAADLYRESPFSAGSTPLMFGRSHGEIPIRRQFYMSVLSRVSCFSLEHYETNLSRYHYFSITREILIIF